MVQRRNYSNQEIEINQEIEEISNHVEDNEDRFERKRNNNSKTKECKVLSNSKNKTTVDFDGYGVIIDGIFDKIVKLEYIGQIGTNNFKIINII